MNQSSDNIKPPHWADKLLEWFCAPHLLEEVQGDLHEKFEKNIKLFGEKTARQEYIKGVLGFIRPFTLKRKTQVLAPLYLPMMLSNYFKIAFRNLLRYKGYSFINIFGLATGMAVAMLIGLWIYDELSYNQYHQNYDRIVQVMQNQTFDGKIKTGDNVPTPLAKALADNYGNDFKHIVLSSWTTEHILSFGDTKFTKKGNFMSPQATELLSLKMLKGTKHGLENPNSVLLSESTAKALFGYENPLGKIVKVDNISNVEVTGIYEDLPYNDSFHEVEYIMPWRLYMATIQWVKEAYENNEWNNNSFQIFAQLADNSEVASVSKKIQYIKRDKGNKEDLKFKAEIFLHPMRDWYLRAEWKDGINAGGRIESVWLFAIIGAFVLLLACINFINLSTARSEKRAKEIGVRKAIGSLKSQLIFQFLTESLLIAALSFVIAVAFMQLLLPFFNELSAKQIDTPLINPWLWLFGIAFTFIIGCLAGFYPALYLSSFQPVKVLKGSFRNLGRFAATPRKLLVVLQFTVSISLIIGTVVVYRQINHAKNRLVGYSREGLLTVRVNTLDIHQHYEAVENDLLKTGSVLSMAKSQGPVTMIWSNNSGFDWRGKDPTTQVEFATIGISHDYGKTVGWKFVDGRDFSRGISTDSSGIVLNETAAKLIGLKNPVGEMIKWGPREFKIIGVTKDMIMSSPYEPVKQAVFYIRKPISPFITIRLTLASNTNEALASIERIFKKYNPASPFEYEFVDQEYAEKFGEEERVSQLTTFFAILAILISCLGLFGLASFIAEQRTKEIGIRKVLGASVLSLWQMLSKDFVVLVFISCLIATPIAYNFMSGWLEKYTYRTEISWWVFVTVGAGALLICLLTISYQAIKAALMNPVKTLKTE